MCLDRWPIWVVWGVRSHFATVWGCYFFLGGGVDCRADLVWILRRGAGGGACGAVSAAADASPGVGVSTQFPPNVIGPGGGLGATYLVQRHPPLP